MFWAAVAILAVALLAVVFLTPKPRIENARPQNLSDANYPRATEGAPVPLIFGTVRLRGPNTIWYGDLLPQPITKKVKTGMFSSKKQVTGYRYYMGLNLALCLGPNVVLKRIWAGKHLAWAGTASGESLITINQPSLFGGDESRGGLSGNVAFYPGSYSQSVDAYLAARIDPDVPAYNGICHVVFGGFYFGNTLSLEPFNFELQRLPSALGIGAAAIINESDCNPMEILFDSVAGGWGRLGISVDHVDLTNWQEAAYTLAAEGHGMSLVIDKANQGREIVEEVMRQIDGVMFQDPDTGKVRVKLIRQDYDSNTLKVLNPDNVLKVSNFTTQQWTETVNQCRVNYINRDKDYAEGSTIEQDFANIGYQGRIKSVTQSYPGCYRGDLAQRLAARSLSYLSVPLKKMRLTCTREAYGLRPGDVFKFSWPEYNIVEQIYRVQRFDLGELTNGRLVLEVVEDRFAASDAVFAAPQPSLWQFPVRNPANVTQYKITEVPYFLNYAANLMPPAGEERQMILARRPSSFSQVYSVYQDTSASFPEDTTVKAIDQVPYPNSAVLATAYGQSAGFATGQDLAAGIVISNPNFAFSEVLRSATAADIRSGINLIMIGDEILGYTNWVDNANGTATLTGVYRGLMDTQPATHAAGAPVYFLDSPDTFSDATYGETAAVYSKIIDSTDLGSYDFASATAINTVNNRRLVRPPPPDWVTVDGSRTPGTIVANPTIAWRQRLRTATQIALESDATETPETGTSYVVRVSTNGGPVAEYAVAAGNTSYLLDVSGRNGSNVVEVQSVLNGNRSRWGSWPITFVVDMDLGPLLLLWPSSPDTTIYDKSIWGVKATLNGQGPSKDTTPGWMTFDGVNDYISLPNSVNYDLTSTWTFQVHVNTSDAAASYRTIVARGTTGVVAGRYAIYVFGGKLEWWVGSSKIVQGVASIADGTDKHLAFVRDGTTYSIYINGVLDASATGPAEAGNNSDTGQRFWIGAETNGGPTRYFSGRMTRVRMDNKALWSAGFTPPVSEQPTGGRVLWDQHFGPQVKGAWGLRKLVSTYAGPLVRIRDTADNSEQDVGADANGDLDAFTVVGNAAVVRLYDQNGSAAHLGQSEPNRQPLLMVAVTPTGKPSIKFDGVDDFLRDEMAAGTGPYLVGNLEMYVAIGPRPSGTSNAYIAIIPTVNDVSPWYRFGVIARGSGWETRYNDGVDRTFSVNGFNNNGTRWGAHWVSGVDTSIFTPYSTAAANDLAGTNVSVDHPESRLHIGAGWGGTDNWGGYVHEIVMISGKAGLYTKIGILNRLHAYWEEMNALETPHRHWALRSRSGQNGYTWFAAGEVQLRETAGGPSLATGGTPSSDGHHASYPPANAFDGNLATFFASNSGLPRTLFYDRGAGNEIVVREVGFLNRADNFGVNEAIEFGEVLYSDDGTNYFLAWPILGNSGQTNAGDWRNFTRPY